MNRVLIAVILVLAISCAPVEPGADHTPQPSDLTPTLQSEFSTYAQSPYGEQWWERKDIPSVFVYEDDNLPVLLSLTDTNDIYLHFSVLADIIDTTDLSIGLEWSHSVRGPWETTNAEILRDSWSDFYHEDTVYLAFRAEWNFFAGEVVSTGSCIPVYARIAVRDRWGNTISSNPVRYWMLVYEVPLHLWVDGRYCDWYLDVENGNSGYRLTAPLVLMGAELRQHSIDPRKIVNVDLYKKPHTSPDVFASWEKIETSITTDSLTTEGGARLSKWRWFVHVSTWTSPVNLRLVIYYEDGSISWDCDGDGKFDDHTLLLEDGGMAQFWPYQYHP